MHGHMNVRFVLLLSCTYRINPSLNPNCISETLQVWVQQPEPEPDPDHLVENYGILQSLTCLHTTLHITGIAFRHRVNFIFFFFGKFAKLRKTTISFVMSVRLYVRPHGTTRLPLDGFSWNLILGAFSKVCWENSRIAGTTIAHSWKYLAHFFLEREMFHTKAVEKIETHIFYSVFFFLKSCHLWGNWKNIVQRDRPQMEIWRMCIACWLPKATNAHTQVVWYAFLFHCNNSCKNAPHCYVIRTTPVILTVYLRWNTVTSKPHMKGQYHNAR
jgi:hypothetical protein